MDVELWRNFRPSLKLSAVQSFFVCIEFPWNGRIQPSRNEKVLNFSILARPPFDFLWCFYFAFIMILISLHLHNRTQHDSIQRDLPFQNIIPSTYTVSLTHFSLNASISTLCKMFVRLQKHDVKSPPQIELNFQRDLLFYARWFRNKKLLCRAPKTRREKNDFSAFPWFWISSGNENVKSEKIKQRNTNLFAFHKLYQQSSASRGNNSKSSIFCRIVLCSLSATKMFLQSFFRTTLCCMQRDFSS